MQTLEELITLLKAQIIERLNIDGMDPEELDEDMPLFGDITGLDSIDALELVVLIHKRYGIKITDSKKARKILYNVRTMAEYISEHRTA
ncbi:MAG: acyl carrier protein [Thermodesulfobacteriota bacterium]|nr:acyl carrier protein [Thermodesulfobacteriota bacterium]